MCLLHDTADLREREFEQIAYRLDAYFSFVEGFADTLGGPEALENGCQVVSRATVFLERHSFQASDTPPCGNLSRGNDDFIASRD